MPYKNLEKKREYNRLYRQQNYASLHEREQKYYETNKEEINFIRKEKRSLTKDEANAKVRKLRAADPGKFRIKDREYYFKNKEQKLATNREWARKHPYRMRSWELKRKYGLTDAQFTDLFNKQDGKCAICKRIPEGRTRWGRLNVDHCHITGKVRGLLCSHCNTVLGYMDDNPELLLSAAKYLLYKEINIEAEVNRNGSHTQQQYTEEGAELGLC